MNKIEGKMIRKVRTKKDAVITGLLFVSWGRNCESGPERMSVVALSHVYCVRFSYFGSFTSLLSLSLVLFPIFLNALFLAGR